MSVCLCHREVEMDWALILGVMAALGHVCAFGLYNQNISRGKTVSNTATWLLWASIAILSTSSYAVMTQALAKFLPSVVCTLAIFVTVWKSCQKVGWRRWVGNMQQMTFWEYLVLGAGVVSIFVWMWYRSAIYANMAVVFATAIAFVPTCIDAWQRPAGDKPLPWLIWVGVYITMMLVIAPHWSSQCQELAYPIVGAVGSYAVAAILIFRKPQKLALA